MKRYGNLYEKIYDMDNLRLAHQNARRGKTKYAEVQEVDKDPERYLLKLHDMLVNRTYKTSEYKVSTRQCGGKEREIFALPYFPDRICQWALMQIMEPIFLKHFTADTYSAIPGRGTHKALYKLRKAIRTDPDGCKYCLKFDIKKYYPSIDHDILKAKYRRLIKDPHVLWLIDEIIDSPDAGIPIGNYLSQYSGNFYLTAFDHWVKEALRVKWYFRYMDDIVIFGSEKEGLHALFVRVADYLKAHLNLTVKYNWQVFPSYIRGIDFVGYRIFKGYTLLRGSIVRNIKRRTLCKESRASYRGWTTHCNAHRFAEKHLRGEAA